MNVTEWDREHLWRFRAKPIRVIDGDTMVVLCDTGFSGRHEAHIRIAGLLAPEWNEPGGMEATGKLRSVMNGLIPSWEWPLRIISRQKETVVSEVRSFERFVADIYILDGMQELVNVRELL
jgi:endonuclease YncB( thermonuclease family)